MSAMISITIIAVRTSNGLPINWYANDSSAAPTMLINANNKNSEYRTDAIRLFIY